MYEIKLTLPCETIIYFTHVPYLIFVYTLRYFDNFEKRCMPFYYGGCEGNANNFDSLEDCQKSCPSQFLQTDVCEKPQDEGPCGDYEKRYVFILYD